MVGLTVVISAVGIVGEKGGDVKLEDRRRRKTGLDRCRNRSSCRRNCTGEGANGARSLAESLWAGVARRRVNRSKGKELGDGPELAQNQRPSSKSPACATTLGRGAGINFSVTCDCLL